MQQTTQIQATSLEITAVSNEKKPNRLVGFFSGIRDKFSKKPQSGNVKKEQVNFTRNKGMDGIEKDLMLDKTELFLLAELLEALFNKKKFVVDDIVDELRKNAELTDEYKELAVDEIQKELGKNANLSKELVSAKLEQAISENPNYTQEQKDFYLSKLADKDFMDKFYDTLGIKDIANKAKSNDELLALVNESFNGNFTKAKEKISESQINSNTMNSLDDTAMKSMSKDEVVSAIAGNLKESKDLADTAGKVRKQE